MPSQILHVLFGKDVIAALYKQLKSEPTAQKTLEKITCGHDKVFSLGCQGPDIFYHSQRQRPVALEYGSLLHRRGFGVFAANLLEMALPDPPLTAYALGFVTHAILDRFCHPYIVYKAGKNYHSFFERIIDVFMLKRLELKEVSSWDQEGLLAETCENPPPGLNELLAKAMAAAFPEKTQKDRQLAKRIDNTFIDSARFYRMSAPANTAIEKMSSANNNQKPLPSKRFLMYTFPEYIPDDIDFLNLQNKTWRYPYIPPSSTQAPQNDCRSFIEIYADAVEAAVNILAPCITQYFISGVFPVTEASAGIGNTGLSIQDEEGKPCPPNICDIFPLEEVLQQQGKLRGII